MSKLSPPWCTYNNYVKVLFDSDSEIKVGDIYALEDDQNCDYQFDIEVSDIDKFLALVKVMDPIVVFGNVSVRVNIVNNVDGRENPYIELFTNLFRGNRNFKDIKTVTDPAGGVHSYVRFYPEVLQFYNDDLTDYNGNCSILAEDIAYELFSDNIDASINFCTAPVKENS